MDVAVPEDLADRLLLATTAACTCQVPSPEIMFHDAMCRYRLFVEAAAEIRALRFHIATGASE